MSFAVGDALDLLDWKRQVFALYEQVRASPDPHQAWQLWRETRDRLYREHRQSPLPPDQRADFPGCSYFAYDSEARVLATVEPSERVQHDVSSSTGAAFPFSKVGTARFSLGGEEQSLAMLWNEGYGGGLFVSFQDETSGEETYPAARYLLDTVKGAELGTTRGRLVFDFNFAYNPSCAYDSSWACPLAPPESQLSIAVRAGEMAPGF
jgi:uncharacterized protein